MDIQPQLGGSYAAIAGLIVSLVGYFFPQLSINPDQVLQVIGSIVIVVGIIRQMYVHTQTVTLANADIAAARMNRV